MIKQAMTAVAWAALSAAPALLGAQTTPPPTEVPQTCDCPVGDTRGDLRNLAAFAPLGLLGALAAAGGAPALFGGAEAPVQNVASAAPATPAAPADPALPGAGGARNASPDPALNDAGPSMNRRNLPEPVSPDSMRAGLRAPNTGTQVPAVLLLGTGFVAIGCVTVLRTRS
jgi:hypothetical protein